MEQNSPKTAQHWAGWAVILAGGRNHCSGSAPSCLTFYHCCQPVL